MADNEYKVQTAASYLAVLRRRWLTLALLFPSILLLFVFLAFILPTMYRSSATILIEAPSISTDLISSTVVSMADQQIEIVQRAVMTPERLEQVVAQIDPYPRLNESPRAKARMVVGDTSIEKVDPITLEPAVASNAFSIHYQNPDPQLARSVTEKISELFMEFNRETRTAQAREAYRFLLGKSEELTDQIQGIEKEVAEFKSSYGDSLPESRVRNEQSLERVQRDIDSAESQVRLYEQQEKLLALQLGQISPTMVASGTDVYTQLGLLRAELAAAQQKYTPDHPDVKRLTRSIEALAAQAKTGGSVQVVPDNPDYLRVSAELDSVRRNLAALRSNLARAQSQRMDYERRLTSTPGVERDFAQLERDRQLAQQQLLDIRTKLRAADVAQTLESEARGERYTLIRNASTPSDPYSPNRLGMIMLGILIGGVVAVGFAILKESSDPTVRSSGDVTELADLRILGAIPKLLTAKDQRKQRLLWGSMAGGYAIAVALVAVTVVISE
jgi:polysaccharide biosynthesis transport protein